MRKNKKLSSKDPAIIFNPNLKKNFNYILKINNDVGISFKSLPLVNGRFFQNSCEIPAPKTRENFSSFLGHENFLNFHWNSNKPALLGVGKTQEFFGINNL